MKTETEINTQIRLGEIKAKSMIYWDGEPRYIEYHNGYIHALEWVLGNSMAEYEKEDK
jgi:hypothetical protein